MRFLGMLGNFWTRLLRGYIQPREDEFFILDGSGADKGGLIYE